MESTTPERIDIAVTPNLEAQRYDVTVNGEAAGLLQYRATRDRVVFVHTEVDPKWGGRGVGSALAKAALDDAVASGRRIVPLCSFIRDYIQRHPGYDDHADMSEDPGSAG